MMRYADRGWKMLVGGVASMVMLGGCGRGKIVLDEPEVGSEVDLAGRKLVEVEVGSEKVVVELAEDLERRSGGGLTYGYQPGAEGVLFEFPKKTISFFHGMGLDKPVDLVWVSDEMNGKYKVVGMDLSLPPAETERIEEARAYGPGVPVTHVLELRRGVVKTKGIRMGDNVVINNVVM